MSLDNLDRLDIVEARRIGQMRFDFSQREMLTDSLAIEVEAALQQNRQLDAEILPRLADEQNVDLVEDQDVRF